MIDLNIEQQLEKAIREHNEDHGINFSGRLITRAINYIMINYKVSKITQEELDDFIETSDVIIEAINFCWNDYLYEEEG